MGRGSLKLGRHCADGILRSFVQPELLGGLGVGTERVLMFTAAACLSSVAIAQAPVNVINTPSVTVENTPAASLFAQVDHAWVIPSPLLFAYTNPAEIGRISCDWYEQVSSDSDSDEQTAFATGLGFAPSSGRISNIICETALPVACSAPVAIPVD